MTTLIVTEKPNVAERIAKSIGNPRKIARDGASYYQVGDTFVAPAVGHVYGLREKRQGQWRYPVFDIEWMPSYKINKSSEFTRKYLKNIEKLTDSCDTFINSCDYDIEGEVIGFNVLRFSCGVDPFGENVFRMKYSTLTKDAILNAYRSLTKIDKGLADAGLTRHTLDWYWGINLSRALSLSARRASRYVTLSIGRIQGPTLKILADREKKIRAFKPTPYWQLELVTEKDNITFSAFHVEDKFWEKEKAENAKKKCGDRASVKSVEKKKFKQKPPTPFDLTTLQTEAYKHLNIDPRRTLDVAQELYTNALISYPRTSSQQLPPAIDFRAILKNLENLGRYKNLCKELLAKSKLKPNNGKKIDPAHPAIYPTGERAELSGEHERIYDLIVRRFLATFGDDAIRQTITAELDNNGEIFATRGTTTIDKGWHTLYGKYAKFKEEELPDLVRGDILSVRDLLLHEKETQPPKRFTPASIIREMESKNLGTKATRSQIVDILFRRGYITGKTIEVTPLGIDIVETLEKYCPEVLSEKLTRKFEKNMEDIQGGKLEKERVIEEGRETIERISNEFKKNERKIGESLRTSISKATVMRESLGDCLKCDGCLVLRKSKDWQFIGCSNYPNCTFTISLPKARIKKSGKCKSCGYATFTVIGKKWRFCINPECPTKVKEKK